MAPKKVPVDPLKALTDSLRVKHGVQWRDGILHDKRVEYFRGKDFGKYFDDHAAKFQVFVEGGRAPQEQKDEFVELLLRRRLVQRVERYYKRPKPGKERLVKWPRKLQEVQEVNLQTYDPDAFYAWSYDRPASPYLLLYSGLVLVAVIGCCLFPLAPYKIKLAVVYLSMTLLTVILGTIAVRGVVAALTWMVIARPFWILPNVTSEELGFFDAFKPVYSWGERMPPTAWNFALRVGTGLGSVGTLWAMHAYAPGSVNLGQGAVHARDSILDMLNLHDPAQLKIGGNATEQNKTGHGARRKGPAGYPGAPRIEL